MVELTERKEDDHSQDSSSFKLEFLKSVIAEQCQEAGFNAATESSLNALSHILDRYFRSLAKKIVSFAEYDFLYGRSHATVADFTAAFRDHSPTVSLKELDLYCNRFRDTDHHSQQMLEFPFPQPAPIEGSRNVPDSMENNANHVTTLPDWMDDQLEFPPIDTKFLEDSSGDGSESPSKEKDEEDNGPLVEIPIADADDEIPVVEAPWGTITSTASVSPESTPVAPPRQLKALSVQNGQLVQHIAPKKWSSRLAVELKLPKFSLAPKPEKRKHKEHKEDVPRSEKEQSSKKQKTKSISPILLNTELPVEPITNERSTEKKSKSKKSSEAPMVLMPPVAAAPVERIKNSSPPERKEERPIHQEPLMVKFKPMKALAPETPSPLPVPKDRDERSEKKHKKKHKEREIKEEPSIPVFIPPVVQPPVEKPKAKLDEMFSQKKRKNPSGSDEQIRPFIPEELEVGEPHKKKAKNVAQQRKSDMERELWNIPSPIPVPPVEPLPKQKHADRSSGSSHASHKSSKSHKSLDQQSFGSQSSKHRVKEEPFSMAPYGSPYQDFQKPPIASAPLSQPPVKLTLKLGGKDVGKKMASVPPPEPQPSSSRSYSQAPVFGEPSFNDIPFKAATRPPVSMYQLDQYAIPSPAPLDLSMGSKSKEKSSSKKEHAAPAPQPKPMPIPKLTIPAAAMRPPEKVKSSHSGHSSHSGSGHSSHSERKKEKKEPSFYVPPTPPPQLAPPTPVAPAEPQTSVSDEPAPATWYCPCCGKMDDGSGVEMVCCDNCEYWYHFTCVGLLAAPSVDKWFCPPCQEKKSAMKSKKGKSKKR